ncbi:intracellular septation protein [Methylosinus sp. sav-2]|uniref:septation protein A n=1 Tax=Methylosinus sp. sav-2 TaxID=2485168 RepID=UPI00047C5C42|nr:septation protein A [Methylosinus sp. sav-2]TDX65806.1 intracellular septation protein [Methylosinus sp. sav-2]
MTQETAAPAKRRLHPGLKFALEMGPLVLFFIVNQKFGIFQATAALMVAVVATLAVSYSITRHLPTMPMVTAVFVLVFGSLTFFLQDENFIKLKVTILYALFGSALLGALWFDKLLLPAVFESAFRLDDAGWRKLTWRWAFFFFFLALLNEFVRRSVATDVWVNFKVFGILPLTLLFAFAQIPLMMRHEQKEDAGEEPDSHF